MINLMKGDCLERMKEIPDGSVDMILTDPPYGTTQCKWDSVIPLEPMWAELKRIIKPNGAIVMTASQPFTTTLIASNMKMFKYCWVWEKTQPTGFQNAWKQPMRNVEDIVVFYRKMPNYQPQGIVKTQRVERNSMRKNSGFINWRSTCANGERFKSEYSNFPRQILKFKKDKGLHPTQKPVALMEYLIKTYTNEGETVLDFTMGSGTTGVACVNTGRKFIGIEMDDHYFEVAKERIDSAQSRLL